MLLLFLLQAGGFKLPFVVTGSLYFLGGLGSMALLPSFSSQCAELLLDDLSQHSKQTKINLRFVYSSQCGWFNTLLLLLRYDANYNKLLKPV